ncbi:DUF6625 family protein [Pseudomonas sp. F1_0610]|uniref:DUF6625 family protein n=1 Tax=Pseudomonas sp. F1_0610 TaxID=3114284 RepID=UPI0039C2B99F
MKKLVVLIPYFGKLPAWFPIFLKSCELNPHVDWYFFTDVDCSKYKVSNVFFVNLTFNEYCKDISEKLSINFYPSSPYKLCDLKPVLGYLNKDIISKYEFWAFSDIDLVYGDLLNYYGDLMSKYDLISNHQNRISGHLTLIRSSSGLENLFLKILNWKEKFESQEHYALDEGAFSKFFIKHKNWPEGLRKIADAFNGLRQKSYFHEAYTTPNAGINWVDGTKNFPQKWYWKNGVITNSLIDIRVPYFHFMDWKKNYSDKNVNIGNINLLDVCFSMEGIV